MESHAKKRALCSLVPFSLSFGATSAAAVKHIREASSASLEHILCWRVRVVHRTRSSLQMKPPSPAHIEKPRHTQISQTLDNFIFSNFFVLNAA